MDVSAVWAAVSMVILLTIVFVVSKGKIPISLGLVAASVVGAFVAGFGFPVRHFVEGQFGYLYVVLVILTGTVFLRTLEANGSLQAIMKALASLLGRKPVLLLFVSMLLLYLPGMVTGLGVTAVISTGALVAPIFVALGIPKSSTAALIALGACLGTVTGPVNIPAMIISNAIFMPYEGFGRVLPAMTVTIGIAATLILGLRHALRADPEAIVNEFRRGRDEVMGLVVYVPIIAVFGFMVLVRAIPTHFPDPGTPLIFMLGALLAMMVGRRVNGWQIVREAVDGPVFTVVALLIAVGVFVQITTLTGVKGMLVVASFRVPKEAILLAAAVLLPLLGGSLTMLGSAAILGVPFVLALMGRNPIMLTAGVSLLCAFGQLVPPTAIVGSLAGQLMGISDYREIIRKATAPTAFAIVVSLIAIILANQLAPYLV